MSSPTMTPGRGERLAWAMRAGAVAILPTQLFVMPFGLVSGVVAQEIGLDFVQTMFLSIGVFAGASQFTIMELLRDGAPALIVIAAGLAVNLRFVMYAASLSTWMGGASLRQRAGLSYLNVDNAFAVASIWFRANPETTSTERIVFHLTGGVITWWVWQFATMVGFFFGATAPAYLSLEYAAPVAFLALSAPVLVDRPSWWAAGVATALALVLHDLPYSLNVLIGGAAGVGAGYWADRRLAEAKEADNNG